MAAKSEDLRVSGALGSTATPERRRGGNIGALCLCRDDGASGRRDYHLRSTSGLAIAVIE